MPGPLLGADHQYAFLHGSDKLIVTPDGKRLLFDLARDPREERATDRPELVAQLARRMAEAIVVRQPQTVSEIGQAVRERMRALGYDF